MNILNEISARLAILAFNIDESPYHNHPSYPYLEDIYNPLMEKFDLPKLGEATYDNDGVMIEAKPEVREVINNILNSDDLEKVLKENSVSDLMEYNDFLIHNMDSQKLPKTSYYHVIKIKQTKNILALLSDGVTALV